MRSSFIIGGANIFQYILGFLQIKVVAILLGPSGIGLIALYKSIIRMLVTISALGINQSSVREIAKANGNQDQVTVSTISSTLIRLSWITGGISWLIAIVFSELINEWVFDSQQNSIIISLIGIAALLAILYNGQIALLQGLRLISQLARINIISALVNTAISIGIYYHLGQEGIIYVLITTALVTLLTGWFFVQRVNFLPTILTFNNTLCNAKNLLRLGVALMLSSLVAAGSDIIIKSIITQEYGLATTGYYQAAWVISGLFAGFILTAMGMDYYPRLSAVIGKDRDACDCVNEQIEIGILLALPMLVGTIVFSSEILHLLYSKDFVKSNSLLVWLSIGVYGRIISWPMGFVMLAKASSLLYASSEVIFGVSNIVLISMLIPNYGIIGVAYAMVINYILYLLFNLFISHRLIGFTYSKEVVELLVKSILFISLAYFVFTFMSEITFAIFSVIINVAVIVWCMRELVSRLGNEHRISKTLANIPIVRSILPL
jgi:enterobacterial common antigen flippase